MPHEVRQLLEKIDKVVAEGCVQQQPRLGRFLQMLANYLEAFTTTVVIFSLTCAVLLPILFFSSDLREKLIWDGGIFSLFGGLIFYSGIWALAFLWGLSTRHSSSKMRRSIWLDWIIRR